jgi:hypothetical protein
MSDQYFGITQYVRPIDFSPHLWLNQVAAVMGGSYERYIGIADINDQRTNRQEEL